MGWVTVAYLERAESATPPPPLLRDGLTLSLTVVLAIMLNFDRFTIRHVILRIFKMIVTMAALRRDFDRSRFGLVRFGSEP